MHANRDPKRVPFEVRTNQDEPRMDLARLHVGWELESEGNERQTIT